MAVAATASATASGRMASFTCRAADAWSDTKTGPPVPRSSCWPSALDGGGQLGEIRAWLGVDERALEVPVRSVDQCGQRARWPGSSPTR